MPKANRDEGDERLRCLFEESQGQLVSPGGAVALLGLSRKTVHTLVEEIRQHVGRDEYVLPAVLRNPGWNTERLDSHPLVETSAQRAPRSQSPRPVNALTQWRQPCCLAGSSS